MCIYLYIYIYIHMYIYIYLYTHMYSLACMYLPYVSQIFCTHTGCISPASLRTDGVQRWDQLKLSATKRPRLRSIPLEFSPRTNRNNWTMAQAPGTPWSRWMISSLRTLSKRYVLLWSSPKEARNGRFPQLVGRNFLCIK